MESGMSLRWLSVLTSFAAVEDGAIPELGGYGIDGSPFADTQHAQPELGPVRSVQRTAHGMELDPRSYHARVLGILSKQSQGRVVHDGPEDGALAFDVQAPPTVFPLS